MPGANRADREAADNSAESVAATAESVSHVYLDGGNWHTLTATPVTPDGEDSTDATSFNVAVADAPLTMTSVTAPAGKTEGQSTGTITVAHFSDGNPYATTGDFTATITWGDGQTSPGTVVSSSSGFDVRGSHTYEQAISGGTFSVAVRDHDGQTISQSASLTVADASLLTSGVTLPVCATVQKIRFLPRSIALALLSDDASHSSA